MTVVINLIGGPGVGKSTLAAELYAKMKQYNMKVEMVREVAKDWAWEGREITAFDQIAIIGEQIKRESMLFDKVDYIITDSPILLGSFYFDYNHDQRFMNQMVKDYYKYSETENVKFLNFVQDRFGTYEEDGRFESKQEAEDIDDALILYLAAEGYTYENLDDRYLGSTRANFIITRLGELK